MTTIRDINSVHGSVLDLPHALSLSDDDCNVLFCSSRTLYFIQAFGRGEMNFVARYSTEFLDGNRYVLAETSTDLDNINDIGNAYELEVVDMSCDVVVALNEIASVLSAGQNNDCGCNIGVDVETTDGEEGGPLPDPVAGIPYEAASAITDRKCLAANYIHMSIRDVVNELKMNRADAYGFAGLSFVLALVATVVGGLILGPFGLLIGAVAGGFLAMALQLFKGSFSLTLLLTAINSNDQDAVCALYNAGTADAARTAYQSYLTAGGATSLEIEFVQYLLSTNLLNLLFFAWGDSEATISAVVPVATCTACVGTCAWAFVTGRGTGDLTMDGSQRTLSSVPVTGGHAIFIELPTVGFCTTRNRDVEVVSVSGWTNWVSASNEAWCSTAVGGFTLLWDNAPTGDPPPSGVNTMTVIAMSSLTAFTAEVVLEGGPVLGPCP